MLTSQMLLSDPALGLIREVRPSQLQMAASIEQVLREGGAYFCEGPVGLGKSLAYLVPTLLAKGRRVVVATAKRALQDQIINKDFPAVHVVIKNVTGPTIATPLKGRSNYACAAAAFSLLEKSGENDARFETFIGHSMYGDRAEYPGAPPRWWSQATAEDCVGKRCGNYNNCGYIRLKRAVADSRLVVTNHHVLGAEMFFGHGKMVGGPYDVLVIDEAHTLAAGIRSAFSHKVGDDSISQLWDVLKRTGRDFPATKKLLRPWEGMFEGVTDRGYESKARDAPVFPGGPADEVIGLLRASLLEIAKTLASYLVADEPDEPDEVSDDIYVGDEPVEGIEGGLDREALADDSAREQALLTQAQRRVDSLLRGLQTAQGIVDPDPIETEGDPDREAMRRARILANTVIYSTSDDRGRFAIQCAPVGVGGIAGRYLSTVKTVVVCSATLAVEGGFDHVTSMTGIAPVKAEVLPTSFNYDAQGFVFVPREMPAVSRYDAEAYADSMRRRVALAVRLVELSDGGAFILTTANDELDMFAAALKERFPRRTFAQGHRNNPHDGDPNAALGKFKATRDAILVGSKSFWEGVDVPGGDLRLVIMAKLPFPQFNDPIVKARERLAGKADAFRDVQLVDMLIDLRQGVGRLIRTRDDRGCVAILDSRVWDKSYGSQVRRALPWSNDLITSNFKVCEQYLPRFTAHFRKVAKLAAGPAFVP